MSYREFRVPIVGGPLHGSHAEENAAGILLAWEPVTHPLAEGDPSEWAHEPKLITYRLRLFGWPGGRSRRVWVDEAMPDDLARRLIARDLLP